MSFRSKLLTLLQNDNTIYQLLLLGLMIASPSLHYLGDYHSYDPISLRVALSAICLVALIISFYNNKTLTAVSQYVVIVAFLGINNYLLLSKNDFAQVYLFSSITIFIALTLFCTKRREFIALGFLNLVATEVAYATAPNP